MMFVVSMLFFFKQKTAYEMRISDWSSDVCSSDLARCAQFLRELGAARRVAVEAVDVALRCVGVDRDVLLEIAIGGDRRQRQAVQIIVEAKRADLAGLAREGRAVERNLKVFRARLDPLRLAFVARAEDGRTERDEAAAASAPRPGPVGLFLYG